MSVKEYKIITKLFGVENLQDLEVYRRHGGYKALEKTLEMAPDDVIERVMGLGPFGTRRGLVFHRHEVGLHAQGA